jgi:hypothetical protein
MNQINECVSRIQEELQKLRNLGVDTNNLDAVDLLLKKGADVNKQLSNGKNALMIACEYGRADIVARLLEEPEVDIWLQNENSLSAKQIAETVGSHHCANLIKLTAAESHIEEQSEEIDDLESRRKHNIVIGTVGSIVTGVVGLFGGAAAAIKMELTYPPATQAPEPAAAVETVKVEDVRDATFEILSGAMGAMYEKAAEDGKVTDTEEKQIEDATKVLIFEGGSKDAIERIIESKAQGKM